MSGTGFGIGDGSGGFVSKLEADGDAKIGNSSGDVLQITGSVVMNENVHFLANGRVGINTDSPAYKLGVAGNVGINEYIYHNGDADTFMRFQEDSVNFQAGGADFITLTEAAQDEVVINESSADIDFRVESNNATHMFFIDGASNRIGVGTSGPQHTIDIQERTGIEAVIRLQGTADVGIRLQADSDNSGENDNPYIDWYQDGQNSNSRNNRLASIAMEGDAGATFTGSIANGLFISTFCPNAQSSSLRPFQIATDSSNNGFRNRLTIEGTNGHVGIGKNNPGVELDVNGTMNATTLQIGGTSVTSTPSELNLLDASVTSEASDGEWAVVERVAKATVDSNDYARSAGPVSLGVTIPDNAILTKYVFDCTQTFAAGDDGTELMAVVDLGLYNASGKVFDLASQANIERTGASSAPYQAAVSQLFPLAAASTKLTEALTVKIHVFDDGSGMLNSLDAGALDIYIYYIIGA